MRDTINLALTLSTQHLLRQRLGLLFYQSRKADLSSNLIIDHISASQGESQARYGRKVGKQAKRTHIKIIVKER